MSMLTCLSFNLTGGSASAIEQKFKTAVENVLADSAARALIGEWTLVWGPVVYADAFVGAKASVNSLFIAVPKSRPDEAIVAIAGTNGISLMGWMIEDFNVREKVEWPYGGAAFSPHISKGVAYGLGKLQALTETTGAGKGLTVREFLAANPAIKKVMVTGHSLGGALTSVYGLYLADTRAEWDRAGDVELSCLITAGQTPGDEGFSRHYGQQLGGRTKRVWNSMDIVPYTYQKEMMLRIPTRFEPHISSQRPIVKLISNLHRETGANNYTHVLPDVEGFPSAFMKIEDIAGEKYKVFIDFINNATTLVRRANPFQFKDMSGTLNFAVHALIQHIFPYFTYFKIDEFIKIMCTPRPRPAPVKAAETPTSVWGRWKAFWARFKGRFARRGA